MNIVIYTPVFKPMVGGMETVAENLATKLAEAGHDVTLLTPIPADNRDNFNFRIVRQPGFFRKLKEARKADVIFSNGASLSMVPFAMLTQTPFAWRHAGYQVSSIDGLGWYKGKQAPVVPLKSIVFHFKNNSVKNTILGTVKLLIRRAVAWYYVKANVAITDWMKYRQPLPRQVRIYNPFPISQFQQIMQSDKKQYDFLYVGRLVSEKGLFNLMDAFYNLSLKYPQISLAIVGDGDQKTDLMNYVNQHKLEDKVFFLGRQKGEKLREIISLAEIAVVPSEWEEPMGGVALELVAAGKNIIVSESGGLAECVGNAGLIFKNGDVNDLILKMERLLTDSELRKQHRANAPQHLEQFNEDKLINQYLELFKRIMG